MHGYLHQQRANENENAAVDIATIATDCLWLRLLAAGESDLHCGGVDPGQRLPDFLRRERFLDMTAGIVAVSGHPLLNREVAEEDLAAYPWVDFDAAAPLDGDAEVSLATLLDRLHETTHRCLPTIIRSGSAGLSVMAGSPYLAWLSLTFLELQPGGLVRPVPVEFGKYTYRSGFVARRAAEDLAPFRRLEAIVRETALDSRH